MRATLSALLVGLALVGGTGWYVPTAQAWLPGGEPQVVVPPPLPDPDPLPDPGPVDPPTKCHCHCHCPKDPPPCHETPEPSAWLLGVVGAGLLGLRSLRRH